MEKEIRKLKWSMIVVSGNFFLPVLVVFDVWVLITERVTNLRHPDSSRLALGLTGICLGLMAKEEVAAHNPRRATTGWHWCRKGGRLRKRKLKMLGNARRVRWLTTQDGACDPRIGRSQS